MHSRSKQWSLWGCALKGSPAQPAKGWRLSTGPAGRHTSCCPARPTFARALQGITFTYPTLGAGYRILVATEDTGTVNYWIFLKAFEW